MSRLSTATLDSLPTGVSRPSYDRASVKSGVVHLGIGAFHRAHQAVVFDRALASGDLRWGIVGASLRSASVAEQMNPQDGLYTLVEREGDTERLEVIGVVSHVLVATQDSVALVCALASPDTHIVTLTVTEKGYWLDPASGALMADAPDVAADIADPAAPRTAIGFVVAGLAARRAAGLPPFTTISCDNLPHNGKRLETAVLQLARAQDASLADWIAANAAFPATMVDRIVPATDPADIMRLTAALGVEDRAMVKTEPFLQWVIEDRFCGPRPDFAALGVQLTAEVAPWEDAKLRLLNGAHSGMAYLGGLAGIDFIDQAVARPEYRAFVERLWDEAQATLSPPPGLDIPAYRAELMARFANSALQHRTRQIAMDGSQKLPQRLLATIAEARAKGLPYAALALAVAGWMRWQCGTTDAGEGFTVDDPLAGETAAALAGRADAASRVDALLGIAAIFPAAIAEDGTVRAELIRAAEAIETLGAAGAVEALANERS